MPDNKKLNLSEQTRADVLAEIGRLQSATGFMAQLVKTGNLNHDEAVCQLTLIRQSHDSLAGILGTDALSSDLAQTQQMLRDANARIHKLENMLGQDITAPAAISRLRACEDWFSTWYQLCGWHYMGVTWTPYCLVFEASDNIDHMADEPEQIMFGDRELAVKIAPCVPYAFLNYDLKKDTFHDCILDTQANHDNLEQLFARTFPSAKITEFSSHLDGADRLLRAKGHVPWEDIEKWHEAILKAADKLPHPTGKLYIEKADLAVRLASRTYTTHADKNQLANDRIRLSWLRLVTKLWGQIMTGLEQDSQLSSSITISAKYPDNTDLTHTFHVGDTRKSIGAWFDEQFKIDWHVDLMGESEDA